MRLQKKIFRIIIMLMLILFVAMSLVSNYKTISTFEAVERRFLEQDMSNLQKYVDDEASRLMGYVSDWGAWDAMYSFMETKDTMRFDELLNGTNLRALDVDLVVVLDADGAPVIGYYINELGDSVPFSEEDFEHLQESAKELLSVGGHRSYVGDQEPVPEFLSLDGSVYLFASNPILMTNWSGPARGVLLAGINFSRKLKTIAELMGIECEFLPVPKAGIPKRWSGEVGVESNADGSANVWQVRGDVLGTDTSYAMVVHTLRPIYNEGKNAVYTSYVWMLINGIILAAAVMELLSHLVLKRIDELRRTADTITNEFKLSLRIPVTQDDEISDLSRSFNVLLATLEHFLMSIPDVMILCDTSGSIILMNLQARRLVGIPKDSQANEGLTISKLVSKEGWSSTAFFQENDGQSVYEGVLCCADNTEVPVEIHQHSVILRKRKLILFLARDLRERKRLETRLAWRLYYDELTGLPNRTSFVEALGQIVESPSGANAGDARTALAFINMDHFKSINAEVGNVNGDMVLIMIAERIKTILERSGALYRTGGDEFAVLISVAAGEKGKQELNLLLEKIRDAISVPCPMGEVVIYPSASIGVLPDVATWRASSAIIERAMSALKRAKRLGLGVIVFFEGDEVQDEVQFSSVVLSMRAEIHAAVKNDEFIPYFQPIYSIKERKLTGFETLVRWMHPKKGFLTPASFVPYAERMGVVSEIDRCMMRRALEAIHRSSERVRSPIYFSANGSSDFLQKPHAADHIRHYLEDAGVGDPSCFVLEVTESVLINNLREVSMTLEKLRDMGVRIFLDDFGTGYSSLQYIHSLPLDCIKLDMGFVRHVFDSEKDARMLHSIIDMANGLNLETIAEGVETLEQLTWLGNAGCHKAQGYFFSKPISWTEAEKLIMKEQVS